MDERKETFWCLGHNFEKQARQHDIQDSQLIELVSLDTFMRVSGITHFYVI
jgi:hypothetical protein